MGWAIGTSDDNNLHTNAPSRIDQSPVNEKSVFELSGSARCRTQGRVGVCAFRNISVKQRILAKRIVELPRDASRRPKVEASIPHLSLTPHARRLEKMVEFQTWEVAAPVLAPRVSPHLRQLCILIAAAAICFLSAWKQQLKRRLFQRLNE